jgi:hypothetical protein
MRKSRCLIGFGSGRAWGDARQTGERGMFPKPFGRPAVGIGYSGEIYSFLLCETNKPPDGEFYFWSRQTGRVMRKSRCLIGFGSGRAWGDARQTGERGMFPKPFGRPAAGIGFSGDYYGLLFCETNKPSDGEFYF